MFGNKKRFEEMNKEIASLKDRVEMLEFEKKHPNGLGLYIDHFCSISDSNYATLKYIKNGKIQDFILEYKNNDLVSVWRLDGEIISNTKTEYYGLTNVEYTHKTKQYRFDIENERLVELCVTSKTEEPDFEKIAEEKVKEDLATIANKTKTNKKQNKKKKNKHNMMASDILIKNKDEVIRLKGLGWSNVKIGKQFGVGEASVWRLLHNKIGTNTKPVSDKSVKANDIVSQNIGEIIKLKNAGATFRELGNKYGVSSTTIYNAIKKTSKAKKQNNLVAELESDSVDYRAKNRFSK